MSQEGNEPSIQLTQELIVMKTRQSMDQITKLNLWGNSLSDVSVLQKMPKLEVVALTVNHISTLKYFQNCNQLRELYLRRNQIQCNIKEIGYLTELKQLKILSLAENPISRNLPSYRLMVLKHLHTHLRTVDWGDCVQSNNAFAHSWFYSVV